MQSFTFLIPRMFYLSWCRGLGDRRLCGEGWPRDPPPEDGPGGGGHESVRAASFGHLAQ